MVFMEARSRGRKQNHLLIAIMIDDHQHHRQQPQASYGIVPLHKFSDIKLWLFQDKILTFRIKQSLIGKMDEAAWAILSPMGAELRK
jgi:hypothetical protein